MARQEADISALTTPCTQRQQALALRADFKIPTQTFTTGPAIMPWGDPMILPKPETATRLVFANDNGLGSTGPEQLCILDAFCALDPSIIGITETQLDTTKYETTTRPFLRHVKSLWQHNNTLLADSKETFTNSWKPGGVAQIVVGGSNIRFRKADRTPPAWDAGYLTPWWAPMASPSLSSPLTESVRVTPSQWALLRPRSNSGVISPGTTSQTRIHELALSPILSIKQLQRNHHDIYLMGDLNESEGAAPIQRIYNECNLVSVFHPQPEEAPHGPTYIPAGTSPDHHACTPRIHQYILSRGIITNGPPSDHLTMFANLSTKGVFGNATNNPTALPRRVLNSKSPKKVNTYVAYLSATMTNHQLFSRMERLSARCARQGHALPGDARLFQTIDAEHTRLRHAAEKRCVQLSYGHSLSPELRSAGENIRYLKRQRPRLSYGHPLSPELRSAGENIRYLKRQRQEAYLRRAMEPPEARARTDTLLAQL